MTGVKGEKLRIRQAPAGRIVRSVKQVVFVLSLGGLFVLSTSVAIYLAMRQPQVKTPQLIGMSLPQAQEMARRLGLELQVKNRRYDDRYPPDAVVDQWPPPGMTIKRGQAMRVVLSQGKRPGPAEAVVAPVEAKPLPEPAAETAPPAPVVRPAPAAPAEPAVVTETKPTPEKVEKAEEKREPVMTGPPPTPPAAKQPETSPEKPSAPPGEPASPARRPGKHGERKPGSHG
ncbi:MAG TPA: PASTA domain-containing protein [Blastocatellia bacterium]|nr:PASTA domain-containing protein [Blastocatellia bacterium]